MPRPPALWRQSQTFRELIGKKAKVLSFTRIYNGPKKLIHRVPYAIGILQLENSKRKITVEICNKNEQNLKIGTSVQLVSRRRQVNEEGLIQYVVKGKIL